MRLFEHRDFEQAILAAEEHFKDRGLKATVIEKDYYVTEALRIVAGAAGDKVIFKGGTSLSKGWNLIQRFSEDVDIFYEPSERAKRVIDREVKALSGLVGEHPALTHMKEESKTSGGFGRSDRFSYMQHFGGVAAISNRVLLEIGAASGKEPVQKMQLRSYIVEFLNDTGASLGAEDEPPFEMSLLHFRRTFVEKLFAIHDKVELFKREGRPIGSYARHYYDLSQLAKTKEVADMLSSNEYTEIKADYDKISREYFGKYYNPPEGLIFATSEAIFPPRELSRTLSAQYEEQCGLLCYGAYSKWDEVLAAFETFKDKL
jgi:hypothetical protein